MRLAPFLLAAALTAPVLAAAAPAAASPGIIYGASVPAPQLGPLPIRRTFYDAPPRSIPGPEVVSFGRWDEAAVRHLVRVAPRGTVLVGKHEPEQEVERGTLSAQVWRAHTIALTRIVREEHRVGTVDVAAVVMRYTLDAPRDRTRAVLLTPDVLAALRSVGGFVGFDSYAGKHANRTADELYGVPARWSAAHRIGWGITETGANRVQPQRWADAFRYLDRMGNPPRYFLAWNPDRRGEAWDVQNDPRSAALWRSQLRTSARP